MAKTSNKKISYQDLYSMYQLNQFLIDETVREAKINYDSDFKKNEAHRRLNKLNKNKEKIIKAFEKQFDNETFYIENNK
jgi:tRNA(Ile)-lysidine synthase TilS/MesJ